MHLQPRAGKQKQPKKAGSEETTKDPQADPEIIALKERLRVGRNNLVIWKRPLMVLYHFGVVCIEFFSSAFHYCFTHPLVTYLGVPATFIWVLLAFQEGSHRWYMDEFRVLVEFIVWWVGLGVLSSVGLGTGMHSGILFLFPHIMYVCLAADECKSLAFTTRTNMWFRDDDAFMCRDDITAPAPTFFGIFGKVFMACLLWGTGTAIGEIPPYAISRAARLAGQANAEFDEIQEEAQDAGPIAAMKNWMISFIKKYGFWGVLVFSAWPNMAFDLCGICCGQFLMPFWTFFGAVLLGKAVIKVNGQALALITVFSQRHMDKLVAVVKYCTSWQSVITFDTILEDSIAKLKRRFHEGHAPVEGSSLIGKAANLGMTLLIGSFALSCVHQFAQKRQSELDRKELEAALKKKSSSK